MFEETPLIGLPTAVPPEEKISRQRLRRAEFVYEFLAITARYPKEPRRRRRRIAMDIVRNRRRSASGCSQ